jgi:hypothetical protein
MRNGCVEESAKPALKTIRYMKLPLTEATVVSLRFEAVGMGSSTCRSLVWISLPVVGVLEPHGFVHGKLDGLGDASKTCKESDWNASWAVLDWK